ncbi:MAG: putative DNA binding domain-containing protein [Planctomycetes bacterium]|nr:putative DNA binding domain-containing protein [Planctomycetota bacterium]
MTLNEIRELLKRLDGHKADDIESEVLECKPWNPHPAAYDSNVRDLRETAVAFANARGGVILLGVADSKRTRQEAIQGAPGVDAERLRKLIYEGTTPHILVDIEDLVEPEGLIRVIRVPRGMPPHTTTEGMAKIRMGKYSQPLTGPEIQKLLFSGGRRDLTAEVITGTGLADLDPEQIAALRKIIETEGDNRAFARLPDGELLRNLGLLQQGELTFAAALLMGLPVTLARFAPQNEVVFLRLSSSTKMDDRRDLKGPLLDVLDQLQRLLEKHLKIETALTRGFAEIAIPDLTWWVAREAILNALVHRDYFVQQSVYVSLYPDRLEISNPGGFIADVRPENILRHPPARRNPLLAGVFQHVGLVNRAGLGVDRIYHELLGLGKRPPSYTGSESFVKVEISLKTHREFAVFVAEERRAGKELDVDDLIVLRGVVDRGHLDRWSAAERLQLTEEQAAEKLIELRDRKYLVAQGRGRGTAYRLDRHLSDRLRGPDHSDQDLPLDDEAVRLRIESVLKERGRMTNADIRRISGYSRTEAVRLARELVGEGIAELRGRGRAAHYVPGKRGRRSK